MRFKLLFLFSCTQWRQLIVVCRWRLTRKYNITGRTYSVCLSLYIPTPDKLTREGWGIAWHFLVLVIKSEAFWITVLSLVKTFRIACLDRIHLQIIEYIPKIYVCCVPSYYLSGMGLLSQFPPFHYFPIFWNRQKNTLTIIHHVHIWQMSSLLSCSSTWQLWLWFDYVLSSNWKFRLRKN